ncbi:MAG: response regulator [Candidatus Hydrogenedentes bacterium]|nr:response regulator [Candidatus Hydrogenedentota bacterium]
MHERIVFGGTPPKSLEPAENPARSTVVLVDWLRADLEPMIPLLERRSLKVASWNRAELAAGAVSPENVCAVLVRIWKSTDNEELAQILTSIGGGKVPVLILADPNVLLDLDTLSAQAHVEALPLNTPVQGLLKRIDLLAALHWQWRMLSRQETEIQALRSILPASLVRLERSGHVTEYRPGKGTPFLAESECGLGNHMEQLFGQDGAFHIAALLPQVLDTGTPANCLCVREQAGAARVFEGRLARLDENSALLLIREQQEAAGSAAALALHDGELRPQALALAAKLSEARAEAQRIGEAAAARTRYFAQLSHEIRTPLNGVIGMAEVLEESELSADQQECVEVIKLSGAALLSAANDILDFSKLEAGGLELENIRFDVRACLEGVAAILRSKAQKQGLDLSVMVHHRVPVRVLGDPSRLRQVLLNLINNALKFTPAGEVTVGVDAAEEDAAHTRLTVTVADTGIGIAPEALGRIFDPYVQAEAATARRFGGTGLGLAISRELVSAMGGTIRAESTPGKGSRFIFDIVLGLPPLPQEALAASDFTSLKGTRVLLVSGTRRGKKLLAMAALAGCLVTEAEDERSALRLLRVAAGKGIPFELVLLHADPPCPDCIALARRIRGEGLLRAARLVLLTTTPLRGDGRNVAAAGIDAYLPLPIAQEELVKCLASVMARCGGSLITRHTWNEGQGDIRILVVDDSPVNQRVVLRMLNRLGLRGDVASDGRECIEAVTSKQYALILMDCQMPVMNGFEATRVIREREGEGRQLPIVAFTAGAMATDRQDCLAAGMNDHLAKPVSMAALTEVLERHLTEAGAGKPYRT